MSFKKSIATLTAVIMIMVCLVPMANSPYVAGGFEDVVHKDSRTDFEEINTIEEFAEKINANPTGNYILMNDLDLEGKDFTSGGFNIRINAVASNGRVSVSVEYEDNGTYVRADGFTIIFNGEENIIDGTMTYDLETGRPYVIIVSGNGGLAALYSADGSSAETIRDSNGNFAMVSNFTGILDGNGYKISGLQIVSENGNAGLFDTLENTVEGLGIIDGYFVSISTAGESISGSIAGEMGNNAKIENCFTTGIVVSYSETDNAYAGGIAGIVSMSDAEIISSLSNSLVASVTEAADSCAGGITGRAIDGKITNNRNTNSVSAISYLGNAYSGGIAGTIDAADVHLNGNSGTITSISAGDSYAGGITGTSDSVIHSSYNMGTVSSIATGQTDAHAYAGGIAGSVNQIYDCFNTSSVSALSSSSDTTVFYSHAGGIVGSSETILIYNCYSVAPFADITASKKGGIIGIVETGGEIYNCYFVGTGSDAIYGSGAANQIIIDFEDNIKNPNVRDDLTKSGGKAQSRFNDRNIFFDGTTIAQGEDDTVVIPGWFDDNSEWQKTDGSSVITFNNYPFIVVDGKLPGEIIVLNSPQSVWAKSGVEVTFSVIAVSDLGLKYQWQESTNGTSWTNISGETSSTLTVSSTSTKSYKCVISTDSVLTATSESSVATLTIYTGEIKTVDDLSQLRSNPTGDYILRADLDLTEIDTNGGVDVTMTPTVNGGNIEFRFTYVNGTDDTLANGLNVWFNGSFGITDNNGSVTFPFAEGTYEVLIGGTVTTSNGNLHSVAVQYNIDTSALEPIAKNSNGNFDPIGSYSIPFSGTLDGNGHTITGLEVAVFSGSQRNDGSGTYASSGLFGYLTGTVKNLILTSGSSLAVAISGTAETHASAGMVAGTVSASTINGCHVDGNVTSLSYTSGNQTSNSGGIVGSSNGALSMNMCSSSGKILSVSPGDADAGGLVGSLNGNGDKRISNGYNTGDIFAYGSSAHTGGITGDGNDAMIANCFSVGARTANDGHGGGISGTMSGGKIINCYFLGSDGEALSGGTFSTEGELDTGRTTDLSGPRTETQLKDRSTYYTGDTTVNGNTVKGWDFTSGEVWRMDGGYPTLFVVTPDDDGDGDDLDLMLIAGIAIAVIVVLLAAYMIYRRRS